MLGREVTVERQNAMSRGLVRSLAAASLVAASLVVWPDADAAAGACASPTAVVEIVPGARVPIPRGQSVLVRLGTDPARGLPVAELHGRRSQDHAHPFEIGARLEREGAPAIALRVEALGPGLARWVPATPPSPGRWAVVAGERRVEVTFGARAPQPGPAAPHLVSMTRQSPDAAGIGSGVVGLGSGRSAGPPSPITVARLEGGVRAPAIGLIVYAATVRGDLPWLVPRDLGSSEQLVVHSPGGRCSFRVPGENPPPPGTQVRVATYDLWGRVSPPSETITVDGT